MNPTSTRPVVTVALIGLNAAVWLFQVYLWLTVGLEGMNGFVGEWGVVPAKLLDGDRPVDLLTPLTSMFMHGGWLHFLGNMWFLWVFGDNVEDALGKGRYVVFYVLCGLAAVVAQVSIEPSSAVPMVGASGAIAGVLAAYVVLYPQARVLTLVPIFILIQFVELPAYVFIFVWFGFQLLSGWASLGQLGQGLGGTAFFAHIGGFVAGLLLVLVLRRDGGRGGRVIHRPRRRSEGPHRLDSRWPR